MAEPDKDVNKVAITNNDSPRLTMSRRAFVKGAAISAAGTVLLDGLSGPANAQALNGEAKMLGPGPVPLSLSVNGGTVVVRADPGTTLAEVLRSDLGLTGTKIGCDRGACSACTVWMDGDVVASCMTLAFDARGKQVRTIEGLAQGGKLHPVQQAFVDYDALQCGFCTPGMVMSCAALVERNPNCTLEDVKAAVSGHLCRCGTYANISKATLAAAGGRSQNPAGAKRGGR
jgi:xanthine dehydrogenase YagT iron-sulfur-binding subunit